MDKRSFQDILMGFLEENAPKNAGREAKPTPQSESQQAQFNSTPFYFWQPPAPQKAKSQNPYSRPDSPAAKPAPLQKAKPTPPPEPLLTLEQLTVTERRWVQILIELGADELSTGLSASRVKKAYRKLVKRVHPDRAPGMQEKFLRLQEAYEGLMSGKISARASDSESASAPSSRRPAAA